MYKITVDSMFVFIRKIWKISLFFPNLLYAPNSIISCQVNNNDFELFQTKFPKLVQITKHMLLFYATQKPKSMF